jgi:glycosyltransferase involved in cell wall biosynthesis
MRIGIDLRYTAASQMGTGVYAETTTLGLASTMAEGDALVGFGEDEALVEALAGRIRYHRIPVSTHGNVDGWPRRLLWDSAIERARLDVVFSPAGLAPLVRSCAAVVTIHDLLFEHEPGYFSPPLLALLKREIPRSVAASDRVVAVSEWTRRDLTATYGIPADRIHVVQQAVRSVFSQTLERGEVRRVLKILGIQPPYILTLSNHAPHKNTVFAIRAFAQWIRNNKSAKHRLVVAGGGPSPQAPTDLAAEIKSLGIEDRVSLIGRVDETYLAALYGGADLFLFPSLFEGWGLPPLESIAMGTPAVVSDRGALPEAVDGAAVILPVGADALDAWVDAIASLVKKGPDAALRKAMETRRKTLFDARGVELRHVLECAIADRAAHHASPPPPVDRSEPSGADRPGHVEGSAPITVAYRADWESPSGFAAAARAQAAALEKVGIAILRDPMCRDTARLKGLRLPGRPFDASTGASAEIVIHQGSPDDFRPVEGKYNIGFLEWETDRLPGDDSRGERYNWVRTLNGLDEIWGASQWTCEVAARSGVTRPTGVFGHPVDTAFLAPGPRRMPRVPLPDGFDPTWTVLVYVGTWDDRKRPDEVIRAYLESFRKEDRALLVAKTYPTGGTNQPDRIQSALAHIYSERKIPLDQAPAIALSDEIWPTEHVRDLYRCAHAFVTATRGEGFGMCAVEAMACGVPLIATRFSAMGDYLTEAVGYPLPHRLEPVPDTIFPWFRPDQSWGVPDRAALGAAMRAVHEDRTEARERGRRARSLVESRYAASVVGPAMRERLSGILRGHR